MSRTVLLAVLLAVLLTSAVVVGLELVNLFNVRITGYVNVPSTTVIERVVSLNISSETGSVAYSLGTIRVSAGEFQVKRFIEEVRGNMTLMLDGVLVLRSENASYEISMPCLLNVSLMCYRATVIIPGYDVPVLLRAGEYNATLVLSWHAAGQGFFSIRIVGELNQLK